MEGLMQAGMSPEMGAPMESDPEEHQVQSDLVFESAKAFLSTPEGTQNLMQAIQGAKDVGVALGKIAAMVVARITKELESAQMPVNPSSLEGAEGGLTKTLVVVYKIANDNGANLVMEDTMAQAYDVAATDLEKMNNGPVS